MRSRPTRRTPPAARACCRAVYVSWDIGDRAPGASGDAFLQVRVDTPLVNGTAINNTARISDNNNGTPVTASAVTTVTSDHQLALSKSAPSIVAAGALLTYTLDYNVTGNAPAPTVVITDVVPANTTFVSCTGGCTQAGSLLTWNLGNLVPGNAGTVSFVVTVGNLLPNGTVINNTARLYDAASRSASATASTTVSQRPRLLARQARHRLRSGAGRRHRGVQHRLVDGRHGSRHQRRHHRRDPGQQRLRQLRRRDLLAGGRHRHLEPGQPESGRERHGHGGGDGGQPAAQRHHPDRQCAHPRQQRRPGHDGE